MAEAAGQVPEGAAQIPAKKPGIRDWSTAKLTRNLRIANMCNGAVLIATGILCFLIAGVQVNFAQVTVATYVVFFVIQALPTMYHRMSLNHVTCYHHTVDTKGAYALPFDVFDTAL